MIHLSIVHALNLSVGSLDRQDYFKNPVSKVDVPDYYDIIQRPMCWNAIDRKLDQHEYLDLQAFEVSQRPVIDL